MSGFAGKACVMTGAGGGMGLAIARALRAEGCAVTAIDPKPEPPEFAAGAGAAGSYVRGDASDEGLVERTVAEAFAAAGRLDYLVNAAGVGWYDRDGPIAEIEMAVWHRVMEINLTAAALMARHAVPCLRRTGAGGAMVHIASVVGLRKHGEHPGGRADRTPTRRRRPGCRRFRARSPCSLRPPASAPTPSAPARC